MYLDDSLFIGAIVSGNIAMEMKTAHSPIHRGPLTWMNGDDVYIIRNGEFIFLATASLPLLSLEKTSNATNNCWRPLTRHRTVNFLHLRLSRKVIRWMPMKRFVPFHPTMFQLPHDSNTMTLGELYNLMNRDPASLLPYSCHTMKLYFQRRVDRQVSRRLLKRYSSGVDLDRYGLRPKPQVTSGLFYCDDYLYFDDCHTSNALTAKINTGLPPGHAHEFYKQYETALRGLLAAGHICHLECQVDGRFRD
jgi:hypothetical protein